MISCFACMQVADGNFDQTQPTTTTDPAPASDVSWSIQP